VANFLIQEDPLCTLKEHLTSNKSFFFLANDYSEENFVLEKFVVKFSSNEISSKFKQSIIGAKEFMTALKAGGVLNYAPIFEDKLEEFLSVNDLRKDRSLSFNSSEKFADESCNIEIICEKK